MRLRTNDLSDLVCGRPRYLLWQKITKPCVSVGFVLAQGFRRTKSGVEGDGGIFRRIDGNSSVHLTFFYGFECFLFVSSRLVKPHICISSPVFFG